MIKSTKILELESVTYENSSETQDIKCAAGKIMRTINILTDNSTVTEQFEEIVIN